MFFKPDNSKELIHHYGSSSGLDKRTWDYYLDEDHYDNCAIGEPGLFAPRREYEETERWFKTI